MSNQDYVDEEVERCEHCGTENPPRPRYCHGGHCLSCPGNSGSICSDCIICYQNNGGVCGMCH